MSFKSLGIASYFLEKLTEEGFTKPFPIQEKAIPAILNNKDVLGIAQTGSGKTASYALPILMNLEGKTSTKNRHINVLVLVPTRELAIQVADVFSNFSKALPFRFKTMAVYGGVSINPQMINMQHVNVLVATPGRLLDLVSSNALHFSELSTLVLDEADKLLNMGFQKEMDKILTLLPSKRQNLLFSATLSPQVQGIEKILLNKPEVIKIEPKETNLDLIKHTAYAVTDARKGPFLRYLIKHYEMQQVLVFTSSIYKAENVVDKLKKNGIEARAIHSKRSQGSRKVALKEFKAGTLRVLVATDLLSRGIDIEFLPYVINYELPRSPKDFIHRIGRTGRAENPGEAISLITSEERHHFKVIQKKMKRWIDLTYTDEVSLHGF